MEGAVRSCLKRPQPLARRSLCNSLERLLPPAISARTISVFLLWLPPQTAACCSCQVPTCLPSGLLMFWVSPLGTRCMSDHTSRSLKLCGLHQLLNPSDKCNKQGLEVRGDTFHFVFSLLCLRLLCWDIGIWGEREKEGFLGRRIVV